MIQVIGAIGSILAVAGVMLNNRMRIECFWLWMISNAISAGLHIYVGLWTLAARDAAFFVLAIQGLNNWRQHADKRLKTQRRKAHKNSLDPGSE